MYVLKRTEERTKCLSDPMKQETMKKKKNKKQKCNKYISNETRKIRDIFMC